MISACIITKNEADNLTKCLTALKRTGVEIVVVDTGSTDSSREVAKEYADITATFEWCDDFAAARNYAADIATNNMILVIDSDEVINNTDINKLQDITNINIGRIGRITIENVYTRQDTEFRERELISRLYDRTKFRYKGRIHEQLVPLDANVVKTYNAPVLVDHIGYDGSKDFRKNKTLRNIRLLKCTLEEEGPDPYIYYQLGKSYYMQENYGQAVEYFEQTFTFDLDPKLEYLVDAVESYGYALVNSGQAAKALQLENLYNDFSWSADYVFMMAFVYMQNEMFNKAIDEFIKASEYKDCKVQGVNSYLAFYNAGVICECTGRTVQAIEFYKKAGNYTKAVSRLNECSKNEQ